MGALEKRIRKRTRPKSGLAARGLSRLDAYRALIASGARDSLKWRVFLAIARAEPDGMTREDLADQLELLLSTVCGRVGELKDEGKIFLVGHRKNPKTGYRLEVYRVTPSPQVSLAAFGVRAPAPRPRVVPVDAGGEDHAKRERAAVVRRAR